MVLDFIIIFVLLVLVFPVVGLWFYVLEHRNEEEGLKLSYIALLITIIYGIAWYTYIYYKLH